MELGWAVVSYLGFGRDRLCSGCVRPSRACRPRRLRHMETLDTIAARRNVRQYTDQPIPADVLHAVPPRRGAAGAIGGKPPGVGHGGGHRPGAAAAAGGRVAGCGHVAGSAATVALIAPAIDDAFRTATLQFDLGQLAMTLILAATDLGVGAGHTAVSEQELARELLGFPEDHFCAWLIALGYPADGPIRPLKAQPPSLRGRRTHGALVGAVTCPGAPRRRPSRRRRSCLRRRWAW